MNVLVSLRSRLVSEGMVSLLASCGHQGVAGGPCGPLPQGFVPDIILADANTIDQSLFASHPEAKVLLIDMGGEKEKIIASLVSFPASGVLSIDTGVPLFKKALQKVAEGQVWVDNDTLKAFLHQGTATQQPVQKGDGVTDREKEIIDFVCRGCTNKEIASSLSLSEHTVKAHLNRIFRKFNTKSRSKLITLHLQDKTG